MRVISGKYKGSNIIGFDIEGTRPTMDRVKESLFASIQNYIKNSVVLDLFAGSGSLGIEAISNGCKSCYFVDKNPELIRIINKNISNIKIKEEVTIIKDDYNNALLNFKNNNIKFDIIILDPPYKLNLINDCIKKIKEYKLLNNKGIIVCEFESEKLIDNGLEIIKEKRYGNKNVVIYRNMEKL